MSLAELELFPGQTVEILSPTGFSTRRTASVVAILPNDLFHVVEDGRDRVEVLPRDRLRAVYTATELSLPEYIGEITSFLPTITTGNSGSGLSDSQFQAVVAAVLQQVQQQLLFGLQLLRPRVTLQPTAATVLAGENAVFLVLGVSAMNTHIITLYQWQISEDAGQTWADIEGATSPEYTLTNAQPFHNGRKFRCRLYNWFGSEASVAASLTVSV